MFDIEQARKNYDLKYKDFEPGYSVEYVRDWVQQHTSIMDFNGTFLDVGCGLGDWSVGLAEDFDVTGIDISGVAIKWARSRSSKATFIQDDVFDLKGKYDVVFCRGLSVFNWPPTEPYFEEVLVKILELTGKLFVYCSWTEEPYGERYKETDGSDGWYKHDPKVIGKLFSYYGDAWVYVADGFLIGEIH